MKATPSASYSVTLRVEYPNQAGSVGKILTAIGEADGDVGAVDIVRQGERSIRDITVNARDSEHAQRVADAIDELPEVGVLDFSDRTFLVHLGGQDRGEVHDVVEDARRSLDGLYTGGRASMPGDSR